MFKEPLSKIAAASVATEDPAPKSVRETIAIEKDRIVKPKEAVVITGRSLASQHRDKKAGKWVPTYRLGKNSIGYLLSDLLALNASREVVTADNTRLVAPGSKRGRTKVLRGADQ